MCCLLCSQDWAWTLGNPLASTSWVSEWPACPMTPPALRTPSVLECCVIQQRRFRNSNLVSGPLTPTVWYTGGQHVKSLELHSDRLLLENSDRTGLRSQNGVQCEFPEHLVQWFRWSGLVFPLSGVYRPAPGEGDPLAVCESQRSFPSDSTVKWSRDCTGTCGNSNCARLLESPWRSAWWSCIHLSLIQVLKWEIIMDGAIPPGHSLFLHLSHIHLNSCTTHWVCKLSIHVRRSSLGRFFTKWVQRIKV